MPKFTATEREKIFSLLLKKGKTLFNEKGFYAVTAEDISLAAGIAKGTFYHFFDNKEHLYMVINNRLQANIFEFLLSMLEEHKSCHNAETFYRMLCYVMEKFIENPLIMNIDAQLWERIVAKAPKSCIDENNDRDLELISMLENSGFMYRYSLEITTKILQMQFIQLSYLKHETQDIELMKIVLKALSEHLIQEEREC